MSESRRVAVIKYSN